MYGSPPTLSSLNASYLVVKQSASLDLDWHGCPSATAEDSQ